MDKGTVAGLRHWNDQPTTPSASLGSPGKAPNPAKLLGVSGDSDGPDSRCNQRAVLLRTLSPIPPGRGVIYWN